MKCILGLLLLSAQMYAVQTFIISAGRYTAGAYQSVVPSDITVTVSGTQTGTADRRILVTFPLTNTPNPKITLPAGNTGSCSGGTCTFVNREITDSLASCDIYNGQWPTNAQGRISEIQVGCVDTDPVGNIWRARTAWTSASSGAGANGDVEGCQCIQGSEGPGPLTWRGNDTWMMGNPFHMADDGQLNSHKQDYWIYRNRVNVTWEGMWHPNNPERSGNIFGIRQQQFEWKGGSNITFEGNWFTGSYQSQGGAANSTLLVFRNINEDSSRILIADNVFEHQTGMFLGGDANYSKSIAYFGPPSRDFAVVNNVSWDINQLGPDTVGVGGNGGWTTPAGVTKGYADPTSSNWAYGWMNQGPTNQEGLVFLQNTFPDARGGVAALNYTYVVPSGGLVYRNNFMSMTRDNLMTYLGIRVEDTVENCNCCGGNNGGFAYLSCYYSGGYKLDGNVWLSHDQSQAAINADGWGTGNFTPANPANYTGIWPKYTVKDWHYDLDPEIYRLPVGSPYIEQGANITRLKAVLGSVGQPEALFDASNNLVVTWLAPDPQVCTVDTSATGDLINSFTRYKTDTGGTRIRKITIPSSGITAATNYKVRINCEREAPVLTVKSNT
jgi:hypothetical protein